MKALGEIPAVEIYSEWVEGSMTTPLWDLVLGLRLPFICKPCLEQLAKATLDTPGLS